MRRRLQDGFLILAAFANSDNGAKNRSMQIIHSKHLAQQIERSVALLSQAADIAAIGFPYFASAPRISPSLCLPSFRVISLP